MTSVQKIGKEIYHDNSFIETIKENSFTKKQKEEILKDYFNESITDYSIINEFYKPFFENLITSTSNSTSNYLFLDNYLIKMNTKNIQTELEYIITKKYYKKTEILRLFYKHYHWLFSINDFGQSLFERYLLFSCDLKPEIDFFKEITTSTQLRKILRNKRIKSSHKELLEELYFTLLKEEKIKNYLLEELFNDHILFEMR